jgi:hypothetical protein
LLKHDTVSRMNVEIVFLEDFEKFFDAFFGVFWSNVGNIASVPGQVAATERKKSNILEMVL